MSTCYKFKSVSVSHQTEMIVKQMIYSVQLFISVRFDIHCIQERTLTANLKSLQKVCGVKLPKGRCLCKEIPVSGLQENNSPFSKEWDGHYIDIKLDPQIQELKYNE